MATIYLNSEKLQKGVINNLGSASNKILNAKSSLDNSTIPYDFKYHNYLNNLKSNLKSYIDQLNGLNCQIVDSINNFNRMCNANSAAIVQKKVVDVPIRKRAVS